MKDMTIFSSELKLLRRWNFFKGDERFWGDKNLIRRWNYFEGIETTFKWRWNIFFYVDENF